MSDIFLGLDLGATKLLSIGLTMEGSVCIRRKYDTGRITGPEKALLLAQRAFHEVNEEGCVVRGVGLGFPGLVDHSSGVAMSSVMIEGWDQVPLAKELENRLGVPCVVDNDVNTAALAEIHRRPEIDSMLFAAVGTGIGGALVLDRHLIRGVSGCAGELGHICVDPNGAGDWSGRNGTLNALSSGTALKNVTGLTGEDLSSAWLARQEDVVRAVESAAFALGLGLANAAYVVNPEMIVLGGGVSSLGQEYLRLVEDSARQALFKEVLDVCGVEFARAGYDAGAVGAAQLVQQEIQRGG